MSLRAIPLPPASLLADATRPGGYADAFETPGTATLPDLIAAFYTQPVFRAERLVLRLAARRPSSDADARALAGGHTDTFAVWRVAARTRDELLLADIYGRTLSWLAVAPGALRFGSAVHPGQGGRLSPLARALLGPHRAYSRLLLAGAARRVEHLAGAAR